jgi:serine phosphatase RsbU (regulator of sigma subunit)
VTTPVTGALGTFAESRAVAEAARPRDHGINDLVLEADRQLLFHRPIDEIIEKVMDLARRAVPYERGLLMLLVGEDIVEKVRRTPVEQAGETFTVSRTVIDHVLRTKESVLTSDAMDDPRFSAHHSVRSEGIRAVLCVPLRSSDNLIGLIYVDSRRETGLFTERELHLLTFLADVAAVKIENANLFKQALEARLRDEKRMAEFQEAARIQKRFLPAESPAIPGYDAFGDTLPCEEVGGDCYDFIALPAGRFGIGLGDVSGHGLPASLLMSTFLASLRALAGAPDSPQRIIARLNRHLCRCFPENGYVTFFYGVLDPARHVMTYVNAGHPPPLLVAPTGVTKFLQLKNLFVGSLADISFRADRVAFRPGDVLISCSDGILEAQGRSGRGFGTQRLTAAVKAARKHSAREIAERIFASVHSHVGDAPHLDDMTVVVLKRAMSRNQTV